MYFCLSASFMAYFIYFLKYRTVPAGCAHVRLGVESVGSEPPGGQVESRSGASDGLRTVHEIARKSWTDESGRYWRLPSKGIARFSDGRSSCGDSAILSNLRAVHRWRWHRRRRSSSRHAIVQRGFRTHSAHRWSDLCRKLSLYWVSFIFILFSFIFNALTPSNKNSYIDNWYPNI